MGGRSTSSSAATTNNQDNRVAVQDGIGLSASSGNVISITDGGTVARGLDTVDSTIAQAIESVNLASANNNEGFTNLLSAAEFNTATKAEAFNALLGAAESLWDRGENLIGQTQKAVADAWSQAQNDKAGTIDNRTIIVLAVAGAATLAIIATRGRRA